MHAASRFRGLATIVAALVAGAIAHAVPSASVQWGNLFSDTPEDNTLLDEDGVTPLTAGTTAAGDGAVVVLGYFVDGTAGLEFSGTWVPLTGPQSPNVAFRTTSIGDDLTNASGALGIFGLQTVFDDADQNLPPVNTQLAVAIFNRASLAASTYCNVATNGNWLWKTLSKPPHPDDTVVIGLGDLDTTWLGGPDSAGMTTVPVAQFPGFPVITNAPTTNLGLDAGAPLAFTPGVTGADPLVRQWFKNGAPLAGENATLSISTSAGPADGGDYLLRVSNAAGVAETRLIRVAVHTSAARLQNISTRGYVGTGDSLLIPGFITVGSGGKPVLVRAIGRTLADPPYNVPGVLANPQLRVVNANSDVELAFNDDWRDQSDSAAVATAIAATGAFPIPDGSRDAALLLDAPTGQRLSVNVTGVGNTTGVVIAEVYVVDDGATPEARLVNISTRGFVGTGDNVMIPGFFLGPGGTRRLLIRAAGPKLAALAPGLPTVILDPVLRVRRVADHEEVASNNNWQDGGQGADISAATAEAGAGFSFSDGSADAALILTVGPSAPATDDRGFTVEVFDANGATGLALAEIYELP